MLVPVQMRHKHVLFPISLKGSIQSLCWKKLVNGTIFCTGTQECTFALSPEHALTMPSNFLNFDKELLISSDDMWLMYIEVVVVLVAH